MPISLGLSRSDGKSIKNKDGAGSSSSVSYEKNEDALKSLKQKTFEKDNYTCQCCGFKSQKYHDIHNFSQDGGEDYKTVCIFCHQCFNLDKVNAMRSGYLLWLPEIPQATLHHIARAIYVARISQGPIADAARKALEEIRLRQQAIQERIGTDDVYVLATVLQDYLTKGHYQRREKKLEGIRLFPADRRIIKEADLEFNQFPQILAYWRSKSGPFGDKNPQKWFDIYHDLKKTA